MKFTITVMLLMNFTQTLATDYLITTGVDGAVDDGNCTLREALLAADTQSAVDQCPAGTSDNTITLDATSGTFFFNQGEMVITNPQNLTINSVGEPFVNLDSNNRFIAAQLAGFTLTIENIEFNAGRDMSGQGGGVLWVDSGIGISNLFVNNVGFYNSESVAADGGAVHYSGAGEVNIKNTIFLNNIADAGAGLALILREGGLISAVDDVAFANHDSSNGRGALHVVVEGGYFVGREIYMAANVASGGDGVAGIYIDTVDKPSDNRVLLFQSVIEDNEGTGLFINNEKGEVDVTRVILRDNFKVNASGDQELYQLRVNSSAVIGHTILSNLLVYRINALQQGGGMLLGVNDDDSIVSVIHSTIYNHAVGVEGNSTAPDPQSLDMRNSIVFGHITDLLNFDFDVDSLIGVDPMFTDSANGDFTLATNSPAVDSVPVSSAIDFLEFDLNFNPRIYNEQPDAGAYERQGLINVNITFLGTGSGSVDYESSGGSTGLCTTDCSFIIPSTEWHFLEAIADAGSVQVIWSENCNFIGGSLNCFLAPSGADINVSVQFIDESEIIFNNGFEELIP